MFNRFSEYEGRFVKKKALCDLSYSYVFHAVRARKLPYSPFFPKKWTFSTQHLKNQARNIHSIPNFQIKL